MKSYHRLIALSFFLFVFPAVALQAFAGSGQAPLSGSLHNVDAQSEGDNMAESKKRREPAPVLPVETGGVRYEAPVDGAVFGFQQDGGIIVARDAKTSALIWARRIYLNPADPSIEQDKQEAYITKMTLSSDRGSLIVEGEHGDVYRFNISMLAVEKIGHQP